MKDQESSAPLQFLILLVAGFLQRRQMHDGSASSSKRARRTRRDATTHLVTMARQTPSWGYTRLRGALKNVGFKLGRSTIARILKENGLEPAPMRGRTMVSKTFLAAHWEAIAAADFFSVEVVTCRGLARYTDLRVTDLGDRAGVLALDPGRLAPLLQEPGVVDHPGGDALAGLHPLHSAPRCELADRAFLPDVDHASLRSRTVLRFFHGHAEVKWCSEVGASSANAGTGAAGSAASAARAGSTATHSDASDAIARYREAGTTRAQQLLKCAGVYPHDSERLSMRWRAPSRMRRACENRRRAR